jgi:endonuclease I
MIKFRNSLLKCNLYNPKHNIIYDDKMPIIYTDVNIIDNKYKKIYYSLEHIYPSSFLNSESRHDLHNIFKTSKFINNARSNYKYIDLYEYIIHKNNSETIIYNDINSKKWLKLDNDNYVNHKYKFFIPNDNSKGIISRAILYMSYNYNLKLFKIINIDTLLNWYYKYPPTKSEIYHNNYVKKIQNTDNKFISCYKKIKVL